MYDLIYTEIAIRQLKKLEKDLQKRILNSLERCRVRPQSYVKRLVASPYYRLRVGEYRVILEIKGDKFIILVLEIDHRKNIYNNNK